MDPIGAINRTGKIVQFVSFATTVITTSSDIYKSANGTSEDVGSIETVYSKLQEFSADLAVDRNDGLMANFPGYAKQITTIQQLSEACKEDCDKLLGIIDSVRIDKRSKLKSVSAALKLLRKSDEISRIDERLKRTQATLTLQICAITSEYYGEICRKYESLQNVSTTYHLRQQDQLEGIRQLLDELGTRVVEPEPTVSDPEPPTFDPEPIILDLESEIFNLEPIVFDPESIVDDLESTIDDHESTAADPEPTVLELKDISSLEQQMSNLSMATRFTSQQQEIIRSLSFSSRRARHERIPEAHVQTFRWAFDENNLEESAGGVLLKWLQNGSGIFWVSGKPGSGKSTFMKFVADDERTRGALLSWTRYKELIIASYYFWISGTEMQKSRQGLLQTLLFDIFRQFPQLVEVVCRSRWAETNAGQSISQDWSISELKDALELIKNQNDIPFNFCFFIDGLDEYDGDHLELCQDLLSLSQSPNIKICVSSRPWNVFTDAFSSNTSSYLCVHHVTCGDIKRYTQCRLREHPRWTHLVNRTGNAEALIEEITEKAQGVFLWVFLVTRMLRDGLTNDDSFSDLQRRVASFPSDLEKFFKHMIDTVDPFYHEKMATILRIALTAPRSLDGLIYSFHYEEHEDEAYAMNMPCTFLSADEGRERREQTSRRLTAHCCGLLEMQDDKVDFLHRTVVDYLRTRGMSDILEAKSPSWFIPELSMLRAYLAVIKRDGYPLSDTDPIKSWDKGLCLRPFKRREILYRYIGYALCYASVVERTNSQASYASFKIINEIESVFIQKHSADIKSDENSRVIFREGVVQADIPNYLAFKLSESQGYLKVFDYPAILLLLHTRIRLNRKKQNGFSCSNEHYKSLAVLLDNGCNPNETYYHPHVRGEKTPWSEIFKSIRDWGGYDSIQFQWYLNTNIFQLFLEHGAHPNATVGGGETVCKVFLSTALESKVRRSSDDYLPYLAALDAFLESGAELPRLILKDSTAPTLKEKLFKNISKGTKGPLAVQITMRLLSCLHEAGEQRPVDWDALEKVCEKRDFIRMKACYGSRLGPKYRDSERVARKRLHEDVEESNKLGTCKQPRRR
ncbi:hypothetical protein PT974_10924 [Cladobotryum mycophilum]|uniref:NACHT domain-containing protein n=1 Tax=Cladobotryum mycophilum TaxID=491253 RepID=A0ABR0SCA0_9HYPO